MIFIVFYLQTVLYPFDEQNKVHSTDSLTKHGIYDILKLDNNKTSDSVMMTLWKNKLFAEPLFEVIYFRGAL